MQKTIQLLPPMMPINIYDCIVLVSIEDEWRPDSIRVSSLTREEAEEYAELMKQEFIRHWQRETDYKK